MTDRPQLTLQTIRDRQRAVGLRKYGIALEDAGLSRGRLALHALEERVDLESYLHTAGLWTEADKDYLDALSDRLLPLADHPKPLPPDVPTPEAVATYGNWWQLGTEVVHVGVEGDRLAVKFADSSGFHRVDPDDGWRGPITLRPR